MNLYFVYNLSLKLYNTYIVLYLIIVNILIIKRMFYKITNNVIDLTNKFSIVSFFDRIF